METYLQVIRVAALIIFSLRSFSARAHTHTLSLALSLALSLSLSLRALELSLRALALSLSLSIFLSLSLSLSLIPIFFTLSSTFFFPRTVYEKSEWRRILSVFCVYSKDFELIHKCLDLHEDDYYVQEQVCF